MKNIIIGLVLGLVVGIIGTKFFENQTPHTNTKQMHKTDSPEEAIADEILQTEIKTDIDESHDEGEIETLFTESKASQPKTIDEYQAALVDLQQTVIEQNKTVQKLKAENKALTENLQDLDSGQGVLAELTAGDIEKAKANIQASLNEASEEYAEVLRSALDAYNSGDALPDADALLRHYADEPDFSWSDVARAYIQNYFAAQPDQNIQLVQLNCRKTYCEIYGFYSSGEQLDNPRQAGSQIQSTFNAMEQAPGFSNLFIGLESASISIDSENSYMTFHNFIRSNRQ